jgi:peptidoglycan/xylan/chitin deacetylase (PgdA/CDA1 family)
VIAAAMPDLTLTFDNGPEPDVTPLVLDILATRGVLSTFFVIGEKVRDPARRALAARAREEGHWIGNHTWTHSIPLGERAEPDIADREVGATQAVIGDLGHPDRLFRPFGRGGALGPHLLNGSVVDYLAAGRFSCVLWNAIPRDWADPDGWVERALEQCRSRDWTLMVLHDLPTGAMKHLDRFLDAVGEAGIRIRQDFASDCVPILRGEIVAPLDGYTTRA